MNINQILFPGITYAAITAEAERELASRRRTYPDRVGSGRMTQADADYQIDIMAAIVGDTRRMSSHYPAHQGKVETAGHAFSWADRRKALERELDLRDRFYPQWIASGRLQKDVAERQIAAMKAILWRYDAGFDWPHAELTGKARREAWQPHWSAIAPRWYQREPAQAAMI